VLNPTVDIHVEIVEKKRSHTHLTFATATDDLLWPSALRHSSLINSQSTFRSATDEETFRH